MMDEHATTLEGRSSGGAGHVGLVDPLDVAAMTDAFTASTPDPCADHVATR